MKRLAAVMAACAFAAAAHAQVATDRPMRIVVPFAVGGPTDIIARVLAPKLAEALKRPVIVENKVGATGAIGASLVAKSPPDGDTLLLGTSSIMAASPNLVANLSYDPVKDFVPISLVATIENILVVHPSVPAGNVPELFASQAGIQWTHVPYKGAAPAIQDVLAGHVQVMFDNVSSAIPNIRAGKLKALGVASLARYPRLPDVPTVAEQGVPGYTTTIWLGLFAPARTPPATLQVLQREIGAAVGSPDYKEKLLAIEMQPQASTSAELAQYLKSDLAKWAKVVKDAGIKPE